MNNKALLPVLLALTAGCSSKPSQDTFPSKPSQEVPATKSQKTEPPVIAKAAVPEAKPQKRIIAERVNAIDLFESYESNALKNDLRYKDKFIEIKGYFKSIRKNDNGEYVMGFSVLANQGPLAQPSVECIVDEGFENGFADYTEEKIVVVSGRVVGMKTIPTAWKGYVIRLDLCRAVNDP